MKLKEILVATNNPGKLLEISELLSPFKVRIRKVSEFNLNESPDEIGKTFNENSLIKARYYGDKSGLTSISDDSGLSIDILNGKPGIYSSRYAFNPSKNKEDYDFAFNKLKFELTKKNISFGFINANFFCSIAIYNPKNNFYKIFDGRIDGRISFPPRGQNGFGYDPIFIPNKHDKTFAEITKKMKDEISHRAIAFKKFANYITNNIESNLLIHN